MDSDGQEETQIDSQWGGIENKKRTLVGDQTRKFVDWPKITTPILGELREVVQHSQRGEDGTPNTHVREL